MLNRIIKYVKTKQTLSLDEDSQQLPLSVVFKNSAWHKEFVDYMNKWVANAPTEEIKVALKLMMEVDLSNVEVIGSLTWDNIDFDNKHICIQEKKYVLSDEVLFLLQDRNHKSGNQNIFTELDALTGYLTQIDSHIRENFEKDTAIYSYYRYLTLANEIVYTKIIENGKAMTRNCMDPWNYLEISTDGMVKPCCNIAFPLFHITQLKSDITPFTYNLFRESLLKGNLRSGCATCHIRPLITIDEFNKSIEVLQKRNLSKTNLSPLPVKNIRIDLTEKCNLRCAYCHVSHPAYKGEDMKDDIFEEVIGHVKDCDPCCKIHINGHGETTFHPNWQKWANELLHLGKRPTIISNLAKNFSDTEINTLAQFREIQISLDSHDEKMMMQIRKAVKPSHVFRQIENINQSAVKQNISPLPIFTFSVGVYYPSIETMPEFMSELAKLKVKSVTFWNLVKHDHNTTTIPLSEFSTQQTILAREKMRSAVQVLKKNNINYEFAGDFLAPDGKKLI